MDTNDVNRSRYLVVNTKANKIWLFPDIPVKEKREKKKLVNMTWEDISKLY